MSTFLVLFYNYTFYKNVFEIYPINAENFAFLISSFIFIAALTSLVFTLFSSRYTTKGILIVVVLVSSLTAYFMNTYQVVIDASMIRNMLQTDMHESLDLLTIKEAAYFIVLGLIPAFVIYKTKIDYRSVKTELLAKLKMIVGVIVLLLSIVYIFMTHYTSFLSEHKPLRYSTNPTYWIYSIGKYIELSATAGEIIVEPIGLDAKIDVNETQQRKLVIMVVGEAARADHFSLNGYKNETNPLLKQENIINFSNMYSCGTSTAHSVPCMFSVYDRNDFTYKKGITTQSVLDVIKTTNEVSILWRDNNSDSKGVALRVPFEDYKGHLNTIRIDGEQRDIGMLVGLDEYIKKQEGKDILIVLHQMGNHGPAYYKRYAKDFETFTPVCETSQLEQCSKEEINNAYDNAILYTDYFLTEVISLLKEHNSDYKTAMIYMSDHGESLGENGIYLHGLPYFMAPDAQKHIGALMWFSPKMREEFDIDALASREAKAYSQDNLFHTLLGIFKVQTEVYQSDKDMLLE